MTFAGYRMLIEGSRQLANDPQGLAKRASHLADTCSEKGQHYPCELMVAPLTKHQFGKPFHRFPLRLP